VGLTGEGARDEQKFKDYSRASQIPTQVWYSAYRWFSVSNINNNSKIRLGLYGEMEKDEATAWLRRFADGGERAFNPQPDPPSPQAVPAVKIEVEDVQGLVARSYAPLRHAAYVPAVFGADTAGARAWVGAIADQVTPADARSAHVRERGHAVNVAFTSDGLRALGLSRDEVATFSREFQEGMATEHRKRVLGDTGPAEPEAWRWGGPKNAPVHAMLFVYAATPERLAELVDGERARAAGLGVALGEPLGTIMLEDDKEHFGFHDGIAQPRLEGMADAKADIPAGEVVLGYPNAYGKLPSSPSVPETEAARRFLRPVPADPDAPGAPPRRDLGRNGTYVVFRQLEQDVRAFWKWVDERAEHDAARRKKLAARMVGRWPNGATLVQHPDEEPATFDAAKGNDFMYSKRDPHGERCPIASHVRRSNPRDGMMPNAKESLLVADRHRLLRRGRAYGPPLAPSFDPADVLKADDPANGDRGLHFICFNSDIVRQFEFVQNTWINSMKFDGLYSEPDPVVAPHADTADPKHPEEVSTFTEPRCPVRHREASIPRFVTMRGGAYLFMPGVSALRYLSSLE
jgi:Dyp-type peroxidase family